MHHPAVMVRWTLRFARPTHPSIALVAMLLAATWLAWGTASAYAQVPIVEEYFIPLPEDDLFDSFDTINSATSSPIKTAISLAVGGDTVIIYDHWENGYEASLASPLDIYSPGGPGCPPANPGGTQIWGNGDRCDGIPLGFSVDTLSNGADVVLLNAVPVPRNPSAIRFDGGDKIGSSYPIALTRSAFPESPGSVLASGTEVFKSNTWGTEYRAPVGQNVSSATNAWEYARIYVMAASNETEVRKNGVSVGTLDAGENLVIPVNVNDLIITTKPAQVNLVTGDVNSSYEMRTFSMAAIPDMGNDYFMPVADRVNNGTSRVAAWLYNPSQTNTITVNWQIGSATGSANVPPGSVVFGPYVGGSDGRAGAHFFTQNGAPFYALAQVDTTPGAGEIYDWGFPLMPNKLLTPQVLVGNGRGCTILGATIGDDTCELGNPDNARSFVWVMPTSGTNVPIYVDYEGGLPVCPETAGTFDSKFTLNALQIRTVQQPDDLDMGGARIWTCAPGVNLAVAWGQDPAKSYSGDDQALDLGTLVVPLPSVQVEKASAFAIDDDGDGAISPGDTITYSIAVVNNGAYPAAVTLTDSLPSELIYKLQSTQYRIVGQPKSPVPDNTAPRTPFPLDETGLSTVNGSPISVPSGKVLEVTYVATIDPGTDCTTTFSNDVDTSASLTGSSTGVGSSNSEIIVLACNPGIDVEKSTNGQDADLPTGPFIATGGQVTWRYTVTNTGDVALTNVQLVDDHLGAITTVCNPAIPTNFAVGASFTCTKTGTAQAGQYENLAAVNARSAISAAQVVSDTDPSHYYGSAPAIVIQKFTNGRDANTPTGPLIQAGAPVTWTYRVTNTGNVPLTSVVVTDTQGVTVTCPQNQLAVQQAMTCTATGIAQPGQYANIGSVTGTPPVGPNVTDTDPSHYFGLNPAVAIKKYTNGEDADDITGPEIQVGDFVVWAYIVTNTGNVPLIIAVTDDQGVAVACSRAILFPNAATTCTGHGIAALGQYTNTATVIGTPLAGNQVTDDDPSHYIGKVFVPTEPDIRIIKLTNGVDADLPPGPNIQSGLPVTWTYLVFNSGSETLTSVTVTDDRGVTVTCPQTTLASLTGMICTATGTAQSGPYENNGSVSGIPPQGPAVTDTNPSHYFGWEASIELKKYTNGEDADEPTGPYIQAGDPATWTYIVTNTGNVPLANVQVTDNQGVTVECPSLVLDPKESMTCTGAPGTATPGQYTNVGTVTALAPDGSSVEDDDPSNYFGAQPDIDILKATNGEDANDEPGPYVPVGDAVTWTYVVTNTGNVTLTNVTVTDDHGVTVTCPTTTLGPLATMTCSASGTAEPGQYANTGTATGTPPAGENVTDNDPSHYFGSEPAIVLKKYTNGEDADAITGPLIVVGDEVEWTYVVTNTGNVVLTNLRLTDSDGTLIACPRLSLLVPGESMTCHGVGVAVEGQYENEATVVATPISGQPDVDSRDPSHYYGMLASIDLEKYTNGEDADEPDGPEITIGDPVTWTYIVTNTSNVPLRGAQVTDDLLGPITCPKTELAPGESMTCTATGEAVDGEYVNNAGVIAYPPEGAEVVDDDPSHYHGTPPTALDEEEQPARPPQLYLPLLNDR